MKCSSFDQNSPISGCLEVVYASNLFWFQIKVKYLENNQSFRDLHILLTRASLLAIAKSIILY